MLVDSHCHLNMIEGTDSPEGLEALLQLARDAGVSHMLCVSVDLETYPRVLEIARAHDNVFASVGVHPNHSDGREPTVQELVEMAADPKVVAIGETGLDYFRSDGELEWQRERFRRHIAAARQVRKPLIIHTREAREDTLQVLREEGAAEVGGVLHCFTEDWEMAQAGMDMNFYVSFSGIVTFKSATTLQDVARRMPLERMLIETDSPYLAPVPHRGKPNQPAYVYHVAEFIAKLRETSVEEIGRRTTENFFALFKTAA